jgi:hypothetical protein
MTISLDLKPDIVGYDALERISRGRICDDHVVDESGSTLKRK